MPKIAIITCARYTACGGGKCFRALQERCGGFVRYASDERVEIVGFATCGGCPGGNVEYAPVEFLKNGCEVVHLATGMVVGYPPCPHLREFSEFITMHFKLPVVIGTHPIPLKYFASHARLGFWGSAGMHNLASDLMSESPGVMKGYD